MTTSSDIDWRERALRAQAELQRLSFVAGNIGIEHPEWPPEYARHLAALSSSLTSVTAQRDAAVEALKRLASMEAFCGSRAVTDHPADQELLARIEFAESALASLDKEGADNAG